MRNYTGREKQKLKEGHEIIIFFNGNEYFIHLTGYVVKLYRECKLYDPFENRVYDTMRGELARRIRVHAIGGGRDKQKLKERHEIIISLDGNEYFIHLTGDIAKLYRECKFYDSFENRHSENSNMKSCMMGFHKINFIIFS